jgi:23S rRNA pseudouridine2605 synthase
VAQASRLWKPLAPSPRNLLHPMTLERLQKYLSRMGLCSRRQAEEWMKAGRVRVNEQVVTELGTKIDAERDVVGVNGRLVQLAPPPITVMLHKPYGYVSSTADPQGRRVIMELLAEELRRLYLVGRLDYDATGLMLLTNDGELAYRLMHPSYQVPRIYRVTVAGEVAPETMKFLAAGVKVHGRRVPAEVAVVKQEAEKTVVELTVREAAHGAGGPSGIEVEAPSLRPPEVGKAVPGDLPPT